jgi:hypothetical protein
MSVYEKQVDNTKDLFNNLKINENTLSRNQKNFINENGFLVLPPPEFIKKNLKKLNKISSELINLEGIKGGWEGKEENYKEGKPFEPNADRLGNLIEKNLIFAELITIPEILAASHEVIKGDLKVGGLNLRNPHKNFGNQALHIDCFPRQKLDEPFSGVVCYIYLDESTIENGATKIIPKTHKKLGWPDDHIKTAAKHEKEFRAVVEAGSVIVLNLNTWHGGATNKNGNPRKTIFIQIKRREEQQLLNYKKYLSDRTKKKLNENQKYLLAVRENDPIQKENSYSVGKEYRKIFGKDRGTIK